MKRTILSYLFLLVSHLCFSHTFVHPGSILTQSELDRIKQHIAAQDQPWYDSWLQLQGSPFGNLSRKASPSAEIGGSNGTRQRASGDAYAALLDAIQWHVTGDNKYADHAVQLLSAWGNQVTTASAELFQFPARSMCIAAEMLRYGDGSFYQGWPENDKANFLKMVRNVLYPACKSQAENNTMTSWSAPAATGVMAAGILLDDDNIYQEGLSYFSNIGIAGSVFNAILANGQVREMGRDNVHAMLALNDLAQMARLAWSQGDDLYSLGDNRLLKGFEYYCNYNLGNEDLYYAPLSNNGSTWYYISTHNNGFRLAPDGLCYENVYHHYKEIKKLDAATLFPHLEAFTKLARPEGQQENLGFGTLLYTIDANSSPMFTAVPQAVADLEARAGIDRVWLSWSDNGRNDASGFKVFRAGDDGVYHELVDKSNYTRKSYCDELVERGKRYSYRLTLYNRAGESQSSEAVTVTMPNPGDLPEGWQVVGIGNGWGKGSFANDLSNSFTVIGGGDGFRRRDEGHAFVYHALAGDGSLSARLVSTREGFNSVGLMLRDSLHSGSAQMGLTLGGNGYRYCYSVSRTTYANQTNWTTGDDFSYAPFWMKVERSGNTVSTYQSRDGRQWYCIDTQTLALHDTAYVGFVVACNSDYQVAFDHVRLDQTAAPDISIEAPGQLMGVCKPGNTVALTWTGVYDADHYVVERATHADGPFVVVGEPATNSWEDTALEQQTYYYRVSARRQTQVSPASEVTAVAVYPIVKAVLTGRVIGTEGSWGNNSQTQRDAVFDGNLSTFFDAPKGHESDAWVGLDLGDGQSARLMEIRFCPRDRYASRMNGGRFQGANSADFSDAADLHVVSTTPVTGSLTSVAIADMGRYRYLRYLTPANGSCNVSEIVFFGETYSQGQPTTVTPSVFEDEVRMQVYDLGGRYLGAEVAGQPHGVYIVKVGDKVTKVLR